jgi:hypothetical protein
MRCIRFLTAAKVVFYFEIAHFSITRNAKKAFGFSLPHATMWQEQSQGGRLFLLMLCSVSFPL